MSPMRPILIPIGLLALSSLSACTHPKNARLELGALSRTPTFSLRSATSSPPPTPQPNTPRSRWSTTVIIAPIDGIAHNPTFRLYAIPHKKDPPRVYGLLPTTTTALDHQSESTISTTLHTLDELGSTITSLIDPFFLHYELTNTHWSPTRPWKRSRQADTWSSGQPPQESQPND
ncbi:MAG: hypothetical protein ACSHX5_04640 [Phycisphaerales bacterium]